MTDSRRPNSKGTPSWHRLGSAFALLPLACQGSDWQGRDAASPSSAPSSSPGQEGVLAQVPAPAPVPPSAPSGAASPATPTSGNEVEGRAAASGVASAPEKNPSGKAGSYFHIEVIGSRESFRSAGVRAQDSELFYMEESGQFLADGRRIETWIATTRAALDRFKTRAKAAGLELKVHETR